MLNPIADPITAPSTDDATETDCDIKPVAPAKLAEKAADTLVAKSVSITSALVFKVDRVEKIEADDGELDWYRYVLKNRTSTINGQRRGSYQCICDYAAEYAEQLNARIVFNPPKWQPRGSKVAPSKVVPRTP